MWTKQMYINNNYNYYYSLFNCFSNVFLLGIWELLNCIIGTIYIFYILLFTISQEINFRT